jgi:sarcosine oxidase
VTVTERQDEVSGPRLSVAVIGLGVAGLTCAIDLAVQGHRVTGYDAGAIGGSQASSHGVAKILRSGSRVPALASMAVAATAWWHELERLSGETLQERTGVRYYGAQGSESLVRTAESLEHHHQPHYFDAKDPFLQDGEACLVEPNAGILFPDRCLAALKAYATDLGVRIHEDTEVEAVHPAGETVDLDLPTGQQTYDCAVLALGAWLPQFADELRPHLRVTRQHLVQISSDAIGDGNPLVWIDQGRSYYGVANLTPGRHVLARHVGGRDAVFPGTGKSAECAPQQAIDADAREVVAENQVSYFAEKFKATGEIRIDNVDTCHYTNTVSSRFIIDRLPGTRNVVVLSACSGQGFKFAPISGSHAARLIGNKNLPADAAESLVSAGSWLPSSVDHRS